MVHWALDRARRVVSPERVLVVVNEGHRPFWETDLADVPRHNLIVQPRNKGTAAGVLLAALTVRIRAGDGAPVIFLPSDHFVADEEVMHGAIVGALRAVTRSRGVVLLGMEPTENDQDYGWILPADTGPVVGVRRFVEKPPAERVSQLLLAGGLVNGFVFAATAQDLVGLCAKALPQFTRLFLAHLQYPLGVSGLQQLYDVIETTDFSREVLQRVSRHLRVVRVPACGWSDLGTPARLQAFLNYTEGVRAVAAARAAERTSAVA